MRLSTDSALVVLVPEVESLVGEFRAKYDSSAADDMPAHITINYPFRPQETSPSKLVETFTGLFSRLAKFEFSIAAIRRFPDVLYLEPVPERPFRKLIQTVADAFPESPPYGGAFKEVIPHLTVAEISDKALLARVSSEFTHSLEGKLPVYSTANGVWWMHKLEGRWIKTARFALEASS